VDDVEAHVAGARDPDDGVEVRAVVVEERADVVKDLRDLLDALVEQAERRRVREHQPGRPLVHLPTQVFEVEVPACVCLDARKLVARHRHARRIRAVGGVRGDDRVALLTPIGEVGAHEHEPGQLALRARGGLQRHGRKPRDLGEDSLQRPHQLERTLGAFVLLVGVEIPESGQPSDALVDPRVVLHRAGPEGVEARVDAERPIRERRDVADELGLGELGQTRSAGACELRGQLGLRQAVVRHASGTSTRSRALEDQRRVVPGASGLRHASTSSRVFASRSMSSGVRLSVTATRSTSSISS